MAYKQVSRLVVRDLNAYLAQRFANMTRKDGWSNRGTDKLDARDHGWGLIYRSIDFVVGGFRTVGLWHGGDAHYGAYHDQNEHPNRFLQLYAPCL